VANLCVRRRRESQPRALLMQLARRCLRELRRFLSNNIPAYLSIRPSSAFCEPFHSRLCAGSHALNTNEHSAHSGILFSGNRLRLTRSFLRKNVSFRPVLRSDLVSRAPKRLSPPACSRSGTRSEARPGLVPLQAESPVCRR